MLKLVLAAFIILLAPGLAVSADTRLVVYNHIAHEPIALNKTVHELLSTRFKVVDVRGKDHVYSRPVPRGGAMPSAPVLHDGRRLPGYVLVVYVVTVDGRAVEPQIVRSTDARLSELALDAMKRWRFQPGLLDGKAVSTTAAQEFQF